MLHGKVPLPNGIWVQVHLRLKIVYVGERVGSELTCVFLQVLGGVVADIDAFHGLHEHFLVVFLELGFSQEGHLLFVDGYTVEHVSLAFEFSTQSTEFLILVVVFLFDLC